VIAGADRSAVLEGKVAVVTGGSRGLGREMVLAFAAAGADVVVASRKLENCEAVACEVRATTGRRALPIACHVGRWDDVARLVDAAYAEFGHVDVLVNNAGMAPLYPRLVDVTEDLFDKVIGVNLKGPFRLCALVGERMMAGNGGTIINISSLAAIRPTAKDLPYAAAKAALNTITLGFAQALGPKVRVNCIMAGPFLTDISQAWDIEGFRAFADDHYALARLGHPREIVGTALYFASDASSFTTGAVIPVDGGVSIASPFPL
jgi:NAD(P)-dependent dehydrogenase (short-subunit alcohol dehydrogenase family)